MASPTSRLLELLELLQTRSLTTGREIADRLGIDARTARRYVGVLQDLGIPVEGQRGVGGGYRIRPGYRLPPLMLGDDEALAVLLGLIAGRRAGLLIESATASETAAAKIRRMLPERLTHRLDALLAQVAFTGPVREAAAPDAGVLLALADAVQHSRPVRMRYIAGDGRRTERTMHPYGLVAHAGRWYVSGLDVGRAEERTFRVDRIADPRPLPGAFRPPSTYDPAERVLSGLARTPYRHEVSLRIQATAEQIRLRLPASVATIHELPDGWQRVELRAEELDWVPGVLAMLDRPFVI